MAVVATAERGLIVYQLENQPSEFRRIDSPLKHQVKFSSSVNFYNSSFFLSYISNVDVVDSFTLVMNISCKYLLVFLMFCAEYFN